MGQGADVELALHCDVLPTVGDGDCVQARSPPRTTTSVSGSGEATRRMAGNEATASRNTDLVRQEGMTKDVKIVSGGKSKLRSSMTERLWIL